jgi:hypothetical protein
MGFEVSGKYRSGIDKVSGFNLFIFISLFPDTSPIPYRRIGVSDMYRDTDTAIQRSICVT